MKYPEIFMFVDTKDRAFPSKIHPKQPMKAQMGSRGIARICL
jgi:hypothetical protein